MFTRHATVQIAKFRSLGLRRVVSWPEATHANDNWRDYRPAAGQRLSARPKLACHWVLTDANRIECRWIVAPDGDSYQCQIIQTAA